MLSKKNLLIITAIFFGMLANASLKHTEGFTKIKNIILSCIFFICVMYCLAVLMKENNIGPIYAIYASSVTLFLYCYGLLFYKEIPTYSSIIGALFIIIGVFLVNNK